MGNKEKIEEALNYIEDVMDANDEKVLSIIREVLEGTSRNFHSINGEAKPPFYFPLLDCENGKFNVWRRRIRLLAEKMSNLNLKKSSRP